MDAKDDALDALKGESEMMKREQITIAKNTVVAGYGILEAGKYLV